MMIYHLLVGNDNGFKVTSSFISEVYPELQKYINKMTLTKTNHLVLAIEDQEEIKMTLEELLKKYFRDEYRDQNFSRFMPKIYREFQYNGIKYFLDLRSRQVLQINLLNTLKELGANIILICEDSYVQQKSFKSISPK
ncbi:MAG: hypothetical protein AAFY45_11245 [Bacteroidota bacterium]